MNHYQVIGVSRTAAPDEIKAAYRRKARELHPDRNPGDKAKESQFKELERAYFVLRDPGRRREYDATLSGLRFEEAHTFAVRAGQDALDYVTDHAQKAAQERLQKKGKLGKKAATAAGAVFDLGREWGRDWLEGTLRRRG